MPGTGGTALCVSLFNLQCELWADAIKVFGLQMRKQKRDVLKLGHKAIKQAGIWRRCDPTIRPQLPPLLYKNIAETLHTLLLLPKTLRFSWFS